MANHEVSNNANHSPENSTGPYAFMPDSVIAINQPIIRDLEPGSWALGQADSVHWDITSRVMTVDTYDAFSVDGIEPYVLKFIPIVQAILHPTTEQFGFIADLRRIENYMKLRMLRKFTPPYEDDERLLVLREQFGTVLLKGVMLRDADDKPLWSGRPEFEEHGFRLTEDVDALMRRYSETQVPQTAPHILARKAYTNLDDGSGMAKIIADPRELNS